MQPSTRYPREHRFEVKLTPQALRDLQRMKAVGHQASRKVLTLAQNPYQGHPLNGKLEGSLALKFSLPGGAYRAAYVVYKGQHMCLIFAVGSHERFYDRAGRRGLPV